MSPHAVTTGAEPSLKGISSITFFGLKHSAQFDEDTTSDPDDDAPPLVPVTNTPPPSDARPLSPFHGIDHLDYVLASDYYPREAKSLSGIALRAFLLGAALALSIVSVATTLALTSSPLWRLPFFLGALSLFHFLEFWTTAAFNTPAADVNAFLLTANWPAYAIAHAVATAECALTSYFLPEPYAPFGSHRLLLAIGLALVVVGQIVRSVAMVTAGRSFNHTVQHRRADSHDLVTTGIYAWLRHPSYFGFFYWAIGTQLVLGNVFSFFGYAIVLWKFFSGRVAHEEELLIKFFGQDYVEYRQRVGTKIPFCG
jgi:protein-S-isoprenylcysteine O-methyltransferase